MKTWFVFLVFITMLVGNCFAKEKPTANNKQGDKQNQTKEQVIVNVKPQLEKVPDVKFSMDILEKDFIDLKYTGFPAVDVIAAIEKLTSSGKGEFESTAEYNTRKTAELSAKFLNGSSLEDIFAFVVPVGKGGKYPNGLEYNFDPDNGNVNLYALPVSSKYIPLNGMGAPSNQERREYKGLDQFNLSEKIEAQSTYEGSNAYGATVTVKKTVKSKAGIAANPIPFCNFEREIVYNDSVVASRFKLENSRAKAELPVMKALIVMKLSDPYIVYNFSYYKPTRDHPIELSVQEKFLTGDILGIVYYSGLTGEVFARLPETFGKSKTASVPEDKPINQ